MVVDTSALMAILLDEDEQADFTSVVERDPAPKVSAVSWVEATMVYVGRRAGGEARTVVDLIDVLGLEVVDVDAAQTRRAIDAFLRFGKGRHPARLNLADCFAYALAATCGEPLLFKGDDFTKTDIARAARP